MWRLSVGVLVCLCVWSATSEGVFAQNGFDYRVTIDNRGRSGVRCVIIDDGSAETADVNPGAMFGENYISNSEVVLVVYVKGIVTGTHKFDPRMNEGIGLIIDQSGRSSPQLRPRRQR